jgi:hypothetical protein
MHSSGQSNKDRYTGPGGLRIWDRSVAEAQTTGDGQPSLFAQSAAASPQSTLHLGFGLERRPQGGSGGSLISVDGYHHVIFSAIPAPTESSVYEEYAPRAAGSAMARFGFGLQKPPADVSLAGWLSLPALVLSSACS